MYQGNKVVFRREEFQRKIGHDRRVKSSKAVVNSLSPLSTCRVTNAKKVQLLEEKCTEIERENRILYEKMLKIKNKTSSFKRISHKKSLNETARKTRMKEINEENSSLFERIKRKESFYRLDSLNDHRKKTEKYLSNISEFPLIGKLKRQMSSTSSSLKKNVPSLKNSGKLLMRQGKILNGRSFLVEIYKNSDNFRIVAFDLAMPDRLMLHLLPCEVQEICGDELDLKKMITRIELIEGTLHILPSRPVSSLN